MLQVFVFLGITSKASLNLESGWYDNERLIEPQANTIVFYTTDGRIPTINDLPIATLQYK